MLPLLWFFLFYLGLQGACSLVCMSIGGAHTRASGVYTQKNKGMQKELPLTSLQVRRLEFVILCKMSN